MKQNASIFIFSIACLFDVFLWGAIFSGKTMDVPREYFLDVGQGDSELAIFPGNIKVMTDAGPDSSVVRSLDAVLGPSDRYIDLAIISHPQLDHFNGFNYLLDHYRFGAFAINGRSDDGVVKEWDALLQKIEQKKIPLLTLGAGDKILMSSSSIVMLSPDASYLQSAELNDTGIVELISTPLFSTLLTADTGFNIETYLLKKFGSFHVDVLKVGHHGSKYSSSDIFLEALRPKIAVIEVGAKNTYGHPSPEALSRLASSSITILRTDKDGTIEIVPEANNMLGITTQK